MSQPTILKLKVSKTGHASITFRNFLNASNTMLINLSIQDIHYNIVTIFDCNTIYDLPCGGKINIVRFGSFSKIRPIFKTANIIVEAKI